MYTLYKFHFLNGISEINQLFDDILIIWPAPVCVYICIYIYDYYYFFAMPFDTLSKQNVDNSISITFLRELKENIVVKIFIDFWIIL